MHIIKSLGWALLVAAMLAGCTAELEAENQRLKGELEQLQNEHTDALAKLRARIAALEAENAKIADLASSKEELARQLAVLKERERQQAERLESLRKMMQQFRDMIAAGKLRVRIVRGKMVVELPENVLFDSGKAELKDKGKETLAEVASVLASIPNREFLVAGHTDNIPMRSRRYPSNWELSAARGVEVAKFLAESDMPANRLAAAGYADTQPVADNDTDEGRAQNRRIEIVLMPNLDELPDLSSLESEIQSGSSTPSE